MKKTASILTLVLSGVALAAGCTVTINDGDGTGGMGGMGGSATGGSATGGGGGATSGDECSDEEFNPMGGAANISCEAPEAPSELIDIVGVYKDTGPGWDFTHTITATKWENDHTTMLFSIVDNDAMYVVGRASETDFSPCVWQKTEWVTVDGDLYYCAAAFDEKSECDAEDKEGADWEDLEAGCFGNPWSLLTPVE